MQRAELGAESRSFPRMKSEQMPRRGWIRAIRDALGVSQSALGARAGISRATVQQMERAEGRRRITLASLDRLAQAMGCQVAFAIVPRGGSLEDVRKRQAFARAEELLAQRLAAAERMPHPREIERRRNRLANKLLRGSPRKLWRTEAPPKRAPSPPLRRPAAAKARRR